MKKLQDDDGGDEYLQYKAVGQVAEMPSLSIGMERSMITMRHANNCVEMKAEHGQQMMVMDTHGDL